jgi:AcrR family transcriptional regulator
MNVHIKTMPKTDNKKEIIVEAALQLFAEHGYSATPISMIAKRAKVSQGLLYNFFPGKKAVLKEIVNMGFADITASMAAYGEITDPAKAIEMHVRATVSIIQERKEFWRLLHALRLQPSVLKEVEKKFKEITTSVTKIFEKVFTQLKVQNPKLEAILFLSQIDGLVILYLQDDSTPLKKLADQLIQRYSK